MNLQEANLGFGFAQSVYGILTLNETLPPFMDRDYALVPFNRIPGEPGHGEKWTANTTLYSVDLNCEEAMQSEGLSERSVPMYEIRYTRFNDSHSFSYEIEEADDWDVIGTQVPGLDVFNEIRETNRSKVISYTSFDVIKQYTAVYGGLEQYTDYHSVVTNMIQRPLMSNNTIVSWYPDNPNPRIPTFFAGFYKNRESVTQPHNRKTGIFCNTQYYAQVVQATVDAFSGRPLNVVPLSPKRTFDATILDTEKFEENLTRGLPWQVIRSRKLPEKKFPTYMDRFVSSNLSYPNGKFDTHPMAILATIAGGSSLDMYLDPQKLQESHEAGFRLLFCRAMIDVLNSSTRLNSTIVAGSSSVTSEAVVVEPIFVYVVEGMLGALSSLLLLLTYQTTRRNIHLQTDPGTVAAAMSLVAENRTLLSRLSRADHMGEHFLQRELEGLRYKLCANGQYIR